ncbi:hypothetical protein Cgig2_016429 [Carnegiea gigantea]|uniref:Zinc finger PMZ-type domain-containing protein n=1 Tax=Carnegiea gigantea TaxID=171969 RepID=A0A9Q1K2I6_9CARY|nr:hypothetical protein Cgig2_016429 [Carnegiea gigantea]
MELLPLGRDGNVRKLMKVNNEYTYLYVAGSEGPDVTEGNIEEGEKVDDPSMVKECMSMARSSVSFDIPDDESDDSSFGSDEDEAGERIEIKQRKTFANTGSVANVKLFNIALRKYGVVLINNRSLVVNHIRRTCSCKWWQLQGLPYAFAMAAIDEQKLRMYVYVSDCYKAATQNMIYINSIHLIEMHDSIIMDNGTSLVIGGEALDNGYN